MELPLLRIGFLCLSASILTPGARAADGTWLAASKSGNWSDSAKWTNGTIASGAGSVATFANPTTAGVANTITLDSSLTLGGIKWNTQSSRSYTLASSGTSVLTFDTGSLTVPEIALNSTTSGQRGILTAALSGTQGLKVSGGDVAYGAIFYWNPSAMGMTGGMTFSGVNVHLQADNKLGSNTLTLQDASLGFETASTAVGNAIVLAGNNNSFKYSAASRDKTLSGTISETGGARDIAYRTDTNVDGRFIVSGTNSYTGNTLIGGVVTGETADNGVIVRATSDGSLGAGTNAGVTFSSANDALELSGGVTIAGKNLTLNGVGNGGNGSLHSLGGVNTWTGNLSTGTDPAGGRIGVDSGGKLVIEGVVSGGGVLDKVLPGTLELAQANLHTGGTKIQVGTLLVSNAEALGGGTVQVRPNGTLAINTGIQAVADGLDLLGGSHLAFTLNALSDGTRLIVLGDQTNGGGASAYNVSIDGAGIVTGQTYTLLSVAGSYESGAVFNLDIAPDYQGSALDWSGGVLSLTVVPEPSAFLLFGLGAGGGLLWRRRLRRA